MHLLSVYMRMHMYNSDDEGRVHTHKSMGTHTHTHTNTHIHTSDLYNYYKYIQHLTIRDVYALCVYLYALSACACV